MTPVNLADLPTNRPFANGKVQIKRGASDVAPNFSAGNNGQMLPDGAGDYMRIFYTPTYPCWWIIHSNVMCHGYPDAVGWRRWDHGLRITPADANGILLGHQCCQQVYDNNTIEWDTVAGTCAFKLAAGIAYTAYLTMEYCSAGTIQIHSGPQWCRIVGRIVGEGAV